MKAAIFDVDGTLLDSMDRWSTSGELYLKSLGHCPEANIGKKFFKMTMDMVAEYILENYEVNKEKEEIKKEINDGMESFYREDVIMKPGAREYLEKLKGMNVKMVIATSTDRQLIEAALTKFNLHGYFQEVLTCSEVGKSKSYPDIFLAASKVLGEEINDTYVFEDGLYSIKTAKSLGYKIVGVYDRVSQEEQESIEKLSDRYILDFLQLL